MRDENVEWFEVEGAGPNPFIAALRACAAGWPRSERTPSVNTGGWVREGFMTTYADVSDANDAVAAKLFVSPRTVQSMWATP